LGLTIEFGSRSEIIRKKFGVYKGLEQARLVKTTVSSRFLRRIIAHGEICENKIADRDYDRNRARNHFSF
jgi:hypothetical protein